MQNTECKKLNIGKLERNIQMAKEQRIKSMRTLNTFLRGFKATKSKKNVVLRLIGLVFYNSKLDLN